MTLAERELLRAARDAIDALYPQATAKTVKRARHRLQRAVIAVEVEDMAALPSIDVPALLRRQAE